MLRPMLLLAAIFALTSLSFGQMTGEVEGTVYDGNGNSVEFARVAMDLEGEGGGCHGGGMGGYEIWTDANGQFSFENVPVGDYEIRAMLMGYGMDYSLIDVNMNQTTTVELVLEHGGGGYGGQMGGCGMSDWDEVTLSGWTLISSNQWCDFYYLDINNNGVGDYQLGFGPPGYEPPSGAELPNAGDEISIVGGQMTMGGWMDDLPMVMVFELNGETWFDPDTSGHHNGYGGGWHENHGCTSNDPVLTSAAGWSIFEDQGNLRDMYLLDIDDNELADYRLDFGAPFYDPGNGATRPNDGDWVEVIGGLIDGCPTYPTILVYEINGMFWREPGDTTGLGAPILSVEGDPFAVIPTNRVIVNAYPNPFNPSTMVKINVPVDSRLKVSVIDVSGREIQSFDRGTVSAGSHQVRVDAHNWAAGVYFIRVNAGGLQKVKKVCLIK